MKFLVLIIGDIFNPILRPTDYLNSNLINLLFLEADLG